MYGRGPLGPRPWHPDTEPAPPDGEDEALRPCRFSTYQENFVGPSNVFRVRLATLWVGGKALCRAIHRGALVYLIRAAWTLRNRILQIVLTAYSFCLWMIIKVPVLYYC